MGKKKEYVYNPGAVFDEEMDLDVPFERLSKRGRKKKRRMIRR